MDPITAPDTVSINRLAATAMAVHLSTLETLSGLPIALAETGDAYRRPILVVGCTGTERIPGSRVYDLTLALSLETTDKTSDATLHAWDDAIWSALATPDLPASLQTAQPGLRVDHTHAPDSQPVTLSQKQRDIAYQIQLVAMKIPAPETE